MKPEGEKQKAESRKQKMESGENEAPEMNPGRIEWPATEPNNTFGETFGAATGVSDPRLQKLRIRNNGAGGKAATVAGYVGPGFHAWP